jgi:hypothetical protein
MLAASATWLTLPASARNLMIQFIGARGRIAVGGAVMAVRGHVRNGVVILDEPTQLPEGATVRVELESPAGGPETKPRRVGG